MILLLESESQIRARAIHEIHKAFKSGYYRCSEDVEYPNYLECLDWIGAVQVFNAEGNGRSLIETAVIKAFDWVKVGIETGVLCDWMIGE